MLKKVYNYPQSIPIYVRGSYHILVLYISLPLLLPVETHLLYVTFYRFIIEWVDIWIQSLTNTGRSAG